MLTKTSNVVAVMCFENPDNLDEAWNKFVGKSSNHVSFIRKVTNNLSVDSRIFLGATPKLVAYNYLRIKSVVDSGDFEPPDIAEFANEKCEEIANDLKVPIESLFSFGRKIDWSKYEHPAKLIVPRSAAIEAAMEYYVTGTDIPLLGIEGVLRL